MDKNQTSIVDLLKTDKIVLPVIQSISEEEIKINKKKFTTNIIINSQGVKPWELIEGKISIKDFNSLKSMDNIPELIIIGVGPILNNPYYEIRDYFSKHNLQFEIMTTKSACRTWNILISERNNICAYLILK